MKLRIIFTVLLIITLYSSTSIYKTIQWPIESNTSVHQLEGSNLLFGLDSNTK